MCVDMLIWNSYLPYVQVRRYFITFIGETLLVNMLLNEDEIWMQNHLYICMKMVRGVVKFGQWNNNIVMDVHVHGCLSLYQILFITIELYVHVL